MHAHARMQAHTHGVGSAGITEFEGSSKFVDVYDTAAAAVELVNDCLKLLRLERATDKLVELGLELGSADLAFHAAQR